MNAIDIALIDEPPTPLAGHLVPGGEESLKASKRRGWSKTALPNVSRQQNQVNMHMFMYTCTLQ